MGKGTRTKGKRNLQKEEINKEKQDGKERKMYEYIPIILSIFALLVSISSFVVSFIFSKADYEYKRDPVITGISAAMEVGNEEEDGKIVAVPLLSKVHIEIEEENNLEDVYIVSANYEVKELPGDDYTKEIEEGFAEKYSDGKADININGYKYFYKFIVFRGLDDTVEIDLFYLKTDEYLKKSEDMFIQFNKVDAINILELEKGHPEEPEFEGEKTMAKQYRTLCDYYKDWL